MASSLSAGLMTIYGFLLSERRVAYSEAVRFEWAKGVEKSRWSMSSWQYEMKQYKRVLPAGGVQAQEKCCRWEGSSLGGNHSLAENRRKGRRAWHHGGLIH